MISFFRRSRLEPCPSHFDDFWVAAHVIFEVPIASHFGSAETLAGFYQNFGLRTTRDSIEETLNAAVREGSIDWLTTEIERIDPFSLDSSLQKEFVGVAGSGIWYTSGRAYYRASATRS